MFKLFAPVLLNFRDLQVADPATACTKLQVPVTPVVSWIALIQRSQERDAQCTFDVKVFGACCCS